jgi:hypothetical protein
MGIIYKLRPTLFYVKSTYNMTGRVGSTELINAESFCLNAKSCSSRKQFPVRHYKPQIPTSTNLINKVLHILKF